MLEINEFKYSESRKEVTIIIIEKVLTLISTDCKASYFHEVGPKKKFIIRKQVWEIKSEWSHRHGSYKPDDSPNNRDFSGDRGGF